MPSSSYRTTAKRAPPLRAIGRDDLAAIGLTPESLVGRILDLDHRVYAVESHGHIGTVEQWAPLFDENPDTWRALIAEDGTLVAYWQIAGLTRERFELAKVGRLHPPDLTSVDYEALRKPGVYDVYFASICIAPEWRDLATRWLLIDSFFCVAERLATRGVLFGEAAAIAHSNEGRRLCEVFGLSSQEGEADHGECFAGDFSAILRSMRPALTRRRPLLVASYDANAARLVTGRPHASSPPESLDPPNNPPNNPPTPAAVATPPTLVAVEESDWLGR